MAPVRLNQIAAKAALQKALLEVKAADQYCMSPRMSQEDRIEALCRKLKVESQMKVKERDLSRLRIANHSSDMKCRSQF